ncbi:MAG: helix-turn-helix domain-containing protein [Candidatus Methanomethylicia archaeon]
MLRLLNSPTEENLKKMIAGEIVLSNNPGKIIRKWRKLLDIKQKELAEVLNLSPSVISDYETGRRQSPGQNFIKKLVETMIDIDKRRGGRAINSFTQILGIATDGILDIQEFTDPIELSRLIDVVKGDVFVDHDLILKRYIYGYTVIDSLRAIQTMSGADFYRLLGANVMRALFFTNVSTGRSPMVAIRVQLIKPVAVFLHGPEKVDELAVKLAKLERIPLIVSKINSIENLLKTLRNISK